MSIILTKGATVVTLSQRVTMPHETHVYAPRQIVGVAEGGAVKVSDVGSDDQFFPLDLRWLTSTERDNLISFIVTTVNWSAETFTYTDEDSTAHTVRFWLSELRMRNTHYLRWTTTLLLRKEIT